MKKPSQVLTTKQAAEFFQIHPLTINRYAREGKIPAFKIGSEWKFHKKQLARWIKDRSRYKIARNGERRLF
ncbi:MAG: helix-turn-helix domain-containing protein [Candidatus Omnitrophota bacterium]